MSEQEREEIILRRKETLGLTVQKITMDMMDKVMKIHTAAAAM